MPRDPSVSDICPHCGNPLASRRHSTCGSATCKQQRLRMIRRRNDASRREQKQAYRKSAKSRATDAAYKQKYRSNPANRAQEAKRKKQYRDAQTFDDRERKRLRDRARYAALTDDERRRLAGLARERYQSKMASLKSDPARHREYLDSIREQRRLTRLEQLMRTAPDDDRDFDT